MLQIGQTATSIKVYTKDDVMSFAHLTGDQNPIHLNQEFAEKTIFKNPIVHGILVLGQISELLANQLPGPGTIYLEQNTLFLRPVYHNSKILCTVTIEEINQEKKRVRLKTVCTNENDEIVIDGHAVVKVPKEIIVGQ